MFHPEGLFLISLHVESADACSPSFKSSVYSFLCVPANPFICFFVCVFLLLVAVVVCENQEEVEKRGSFPGQVQADGWTVLSPMHPRESGEKTRGMKGLFEDNKRTNSQRQMGEVHRFRLT